MLIKYDENRNLNIPFLFEVAALLATFAHPNHPNHIVSLCPWG